LGAALFTLVGAYGVKGFSIGGVSSVSFDPTRIAAQVVTGIGFLGAGAIIRYGGSVRGLTTAAALWVTAAVGTAVGFGFWDAAIATTMVTVVALYGLKWFERKTLGRLKRGRHEFAVDALPQLKITDLAGAIESRRARIISVRMESDDQGNQQLMLFVQLPGGMSPGDLLEALKTVDGVASISWLR
jgi:putative Mg2+ transporter-C (MgtC) family protein